MGKEANAFFRLSEVMALLLSERHRGSEGEPMLTVNKICELTGIPIEVVRSDILCLCGDENIRKSLCVGNDHDADKWIGALKRRERSSLETGIGIEGELFIGADLENAFFVNLSPFEKNVLAKTTHLSHISDSVWIKDPPLCAGKDELRVMGQLQMAIEQGKKVSFEYESPGMTEVYKDFCPRLLYETLEDKEVYVAGFSEDSGLLLKRLAHISKVRELEDKVPRLKGGELDILDNLWGADVSSDEAVHVKVKIFKETKNIYEKIKTETNARKYGKLYDDPDDPAVAYYEDDVCGMKAFMRWLMGYGASVMVLEPLSLAEEIYQNAVNRLKMYEETEKN